MSSASADDHPPELSTSWGEGISADIALRLHRRRGVGDDAGRERIDQRAAAEPQTVQVHPTASGGGGRPDLRGRARVGPVTDGLPWCSQTGAPAGTALSGASLRSSTSSTDSLCGRQHAWVNDEMYRARRGRYDDADSGWLRLHHHPLRVRELGSHPVGKAIRSQTAFRAFGLPDAVQQVGSDEGGDLVWLS